VLIVRSPVVALCVITEGNDAAPAENEVEADEPPAKRPLRPTANCKVVRAVAGVREGATLTLSVGIATGRKPPLILKQDEQWLLFMGAQRQGRYPVIRAAQVEGDQVTGFRVRESDYGPIVSDGRMPLDEALAAVTKAVDDHVAAANYDTSPDAKSADELLGDIGNNDELNRKIVGALAERRACPQLLALLNMPPPGLLLHTATIRGLGQCPGEANEDALIALLTSERPAIAGAAAEALAELKSSRALEPLLAIARAETGVLSHSVARALAATGDPRALEPLLEARKRMIAEEDKAGPTSTQPWRRADYLGMLRGFDDPRVREAAKEELQSDNYAVVVLAAEMLHERGDPAGIDRLLAMLEQDTSYVGQSIIVGALTRMKDEKAVPGLIKLLGATQDANLRRRAADALGVITGEQFGEDAAGWQEWWDQRNK
jgi:HEAT repeat protein